MVVVAILLAAGSGTRLGLASPKAFHLLDGRTLLERSYEALTSHPRVGSVIVTVPIDRVESVHAQMSGRATVIAGGRTRQESVRCALAVIPQDVRMVLVHDSARPFVPTEVIERVLVEIDKGADAAIPALAVTDTIKRVGADGGVVSTLNRDELRYVQTPQAFRRRALADAHTYARISGLREVTDDAALVERHGGWVVVVEGADCAFKITRPWDLLLAEAYLARST